MGKRVYQISRCSPRNGGGVIELEHRVVKLQKWLPAGPTADGQGYRERTLVQFIARKGGIRTVAVDDLVVL